MVIETAGLFDGERMRACSNRARWCWPFFYGIANSFGRFEIDPSKIIARAFWSFREDDAWPKPDEKAVLEMLNEYTLNNLLFIYRASGGLWGQWDTQEKYLPHYKTARDRLTPAPDRKEFEEWKKAYVVKKLGASQRFPKLCGKISELSPLGIGIGKGIGKDSCSSATPDERIIAPDKRPTGLTEHPEKSGPAPAQSTLSDEIVAKPLLLQQEVQGTHNPFDEWFEREFWPLYPRKVAKAGAKKSARKKGKSEAGRQEIIQGLKRQLPELRSRELEFVPYPQTWLKQKRYLDDEPSRDAPPQPTGTGMPDLSYLKKGKPYHQLVAEQRDNEQGEDH
jgi:hypothetical protein